MSAAAEDLEALQAKAAAAQADVNQRLAEIEDQERQERDERLARLEEYDRRRLAEYSDEALQAQEQGAYEDFRQAVADDPVFRAWAEWRALRIKRQRLAGEMQGIADTYEIPKAFHAPGPGADRFDSALNDALSRLMHFIADEEADKEASARQAYAATGKARQ